MPHGVLRQTATPPLDEGVDRGGHVGAQQPRQVGQHEGDWLAELREDATPERAVDAETAAELVRELWRALEEFNLAPQLAFEALFVRLRRAFAGALVA